ncbi:hypothetical protein F511_18837 [Dorcoceras hygrometricum]|uniref:Uncharacterized protein n=1 Tax=Dorcoceras hygrometricum TaxID=472368 RepID=A0A2Z7C9L8_9LAMI|nr:hypothetical protein F511_18837 [Dorcoceras hygrometricum]
MPHGRCTTARTRAAGCARPCAQRVRMGAATCTHSTRRDTASRGLTTIVTPKSQFRTDPSDHDSIGYPRTKASGESSTTKHRILRALGPHPIPPPDDPN